jgi:hypothetical protein
MLTKEKSVRIACEPLELFILIAIIIVAIYTVPIFEDWGKWAERGITHVQLRGSWNTEW